MFEIHPEFLKFLELLEEKKEGVPLTYYQESIDFLIALFGDGDCRDHMLGGIIITGTDILIKMYPQGQENRFAGIKVWGGIQGFLSRHYQEKCGKAYGTFVERHNSMKIQIRVAEILDLLVKGKEATQRYAQYKEDIDKYLTQQNPVVHIPLLFPEKIPIVH